MSPSSFLSPALSKLFTAQSHNSVSNEARRTLRGFHPHKQRSIKSEIDGERETNSSLEEKHTPMPTLDRLNLSEVSTSFSEEIAENAPDCSKCDKSDLLMVSISGGRTIFSGTQKVIKLSPEKNTVLANRETDRVPKFRDVIGPDDRASSRYTFLSHVSHPIIIFMADEATKNPRRNNNRARSNGACDLKNDHSDPEVRKKSSR